VIKILDLKTVSKFNLEVSFSNGDTVHFDAADYLANRIGSLLEPLRQIDFFNKCFVDAGALCWPNGLELSAERVHELSKILV
jgi:hypothetical protein